MENRSKAQIKKLEKIFGKLHSLYGNAINEYVWSLAHNYKFFCKNDSFNTSHIGILFNKYQKN